jgi:hypothetical protein
MNFQNLQNEVRKYLHVQGAEIMDQIQSAINESILDFVRMKEWEKIKVSDVITIDGSNSYSLDDSIATPNVSNEFHGEIMLFDANGAQFEKVNYETYLALPSKTGYFAILGDMLYVTGDATTYTFMYVTTGSDFPMTDDAHEVPATKYYWDIIKKMAIVNVLDFLGDEAVANEQNKLTQKLEMLKRHENRIRKNAKLHQVGRTQ